MVLRITSLKQASLAQIRRGAASRRWKSSVTTGAAPAPAKPGSRQWPDGESATPCRNTADNKQLDLTSFYTSISRNEKQRTSQEREFLASVFASSPTKRDTKKYLQTFGPSSGKFFLDDSFRPVNEIPRFVQGPAIEIAKTAENQLRVAIIKLQDPDKIDDVTLRGLAKTFVQLRQLGLLSVVVIGRTAATPPAAEDTQIGNGALEHGWFNYVTHETQRVVDAIDSYVGPVTSLVGSAMRLDDSSARHDGQHARLDDSIYAPGLIQVDSESSLLQLLRKGDIAVIPPYAFSTSQSEANLVDSDDIVLGLTRYFTGIQQALSSANADSDTATESKKPASIASVDRVIVIDPIGGTPTPSRPNGAHLFFNMEEEYKTSKVILDKMVATSCLKPVGGESAAQVGARHQANLDIIRKTLALLPSTSSALLTTPTEAANLKTNDRVSANEADDIFGYVGSASTRRDQNPLIHNLLTDRPVFSSSLPLGRIKPKSKRNSFFTPSNIPTTATPPETAADDVPMSKTTLLKRGMPLTIFPDPSKAPWTPPVPGGPRLRLTDMCIDLPRLVNLIEDSFNRKLDVDDYLRRVENSLAGVIIAGEYEGGAILTWERPFGMDEETAYKTGRLVPYLDKFAVLKKSQGAGGVADIVFTAMVRDCFPDGVCWRSRKDNPVNRWYFERSRGSYKLDGVNWTMFFTTPFEGVGEKGFWDYESVCRGVEPSWLDQKHILD